ncbi:MAG: Divalent-cation tolerance protein CutA [Syntrophaceae bacterium PtaB.Bin038]|nr:MAG: Divalent-cation tolerance protein CutA [Syntrophaceae bacterium PtaB.Bin038]
MSEFIQVTTTAPSREEADRIAQTLVERRLAACVQIAGPVESFYRWKGALERSTEWLCLIKTRRANYAAVEAAIRAGHPYEVPEIISFPIEAGSEPYLAWLRAETAE